MCTVSTNVESPYLGNVKVLTEAISMCSYYSSTKSPMSKSCYRHNVNYKLYLMLFITESASAAPRYAHCPPPPTHLSITGSETAGELPNQLVERLTTPVVRRWGGIIFVHQLIPA